MAVWMDSQLFTQVMKFFMIWKVIGQKDISEEVVHLIRYKNRQTL